jgi:hypothetical protein
MGRAGSQLMWMGWRRTDAWSPWREVCRAETLDLCHRLLLAAVNGQCVKNANLFLTGGHVTPAKLTAGERR